MSATTTAVKERPMLYSGPMVCAINEGRKWQTRRVVNPQPRANGLGYTMTAPGVATLCGPDYPDGDADEVRCPYGQPGDRLWVRETWDCWDYMASYAEPTHKLLVAYRAGGEHWVGVDASTFNRIKESIRRDNDRKWRPSIHMPRWASRFTLEITRVRVERLQDISEEDAVAEGIERVSQLGILRASGWRDYSGATAGFMSACESFASLWDSINAKRGLSWATNPWVWAIDFKKL